MADEQDKFLDEAVAQVQQQGFEMLKALDAGKLKQALEHAAALVAALATSSLSPKAYYELYMQVFDNLNRLERSVLEAQRRGQDISALYEVVQYNTGLLPRLYLLITIGSVYIQAKTVPATQMIKDLIDMTKGVQHPVRGLFLRYYLNKMCKDKLPDVGSEYSSGSEDVSESIDFLLQNFSEMNRLWIRMQHTGSVKDKTRREQERSDLKVTVGENIVRLAALEGITLELYQAVVLPRVLEVVTSNKDAISQQYLMDCIIHAFPDDYHLHTLEPLLEAATQLQAAVEVKTIFISLLNRLSDYAGESELERVRERDIFTLIKNFIDKIIEEGKPGETKRILALEVAFMRLSLKAYPESVENVNTILQECVTLIAKNHPDGRVEADSLRSLMNLLLYPLDTLPLSILTMSNYPVLMSYLQFTARRQVAVMIVGTVIEKKIALNDYGQLVKLLEFINPLLADSSDGVEIDPTNFQEGQSAVAKLPHLVYADTPQGYFDLLGLLTSAFLKGGAKRLRFTCSSLVFAYLQQLPQHSAAPELLEKTIQILFKLTEDFPAICPLLALKLNLQCLQGIDAVVSKGSEFEESAYEFAAQALVLYQDSVSDPQEQAGAICLITATFASLRSFGTENTDTLFSNCKQYAACQHSKEDSCTGLVYSSQLFLSENLRDDARALECLQRAQLVVTRCEEGPKQMKLYVKVLNSYLAMYSKKVSGATPEVIKQMAERCREQSRALERRGQRKDVQVYFQNVVRYVARRRAEGEMTDIEVN